MTERTITVHIPVTPEEMAMIERATELDKTWNMEEWPGTL